MNVIQARAIHFDVLCYSMKGFEIAGNGNGRVSKEGFETKNISKEGAADRKAIWETVFAHHHRPMLHQKNPFLL